MEAVAFADARALVGGFAAQPLAHDIVGACGARTRAGVSYMMRQGVPPGALMVAANFVPDLSPSGLLRAYVNDEIMSTAPPFVPMSFAGRIAYDVDRPADWKRRGVIREGDAVFTRSLMAGAPEVLDGVPGVNMRAVAGGGGLWWAPDTTHAALYANHFAVGLHVRRPGRAPELMVVDTAQNKRAPVTMAKWRRGQKFPGAVSAVAGIGEPFRIHWETLGPGGTARLARAVGLADGPTHDRLSAAWQDMPRARQNDVTTEFFRFPHPSDPSAIGANDFLTRYSSDMRRVLTAETGLFAPGDDVRAALGQVARLMAPLETYERWLRRTDQAVARRFPAARGPEMHASPSHAPARARIPGRSLDKSRGLGG